MFIKDSYFSSYLKYPVHYINLILTTTLTFNYKRQLMNNLDHHFPHVKKGQQPLVTFDNHPSSDDEMMTVDIAL